MEKYNTLLDQLDQIYKSFDVYDLMKIVIKRDDVHEFEKLWKMFDKGITSLDQVVDRQRCLEQHCTQGYCALAVEYNAIKIFKWILDNRWGYMDGHWDRVWREPGILFSIVSFDRVDMMKMLIESGKHVVIVDYAFKSCEMMNIIFNEMEQGKYFYSQSRQVKMNVYQYLSLYLFLAQTPEVVESLLSMGIKLDDKCIIRYIDYNRFDILVYLVDNRYISSSHLTRCFIKYYNNNGYKYGNVLNLFIKLREFGYIKCDDVYDEVYQSILDYTIQSYFPNVDIFKQYYKLGANVGDLTNYKYNNRVLEYILAHNTDVESKKLVNYINHNMIRYTPIMTTTNGYKMVNPDVFDRFKPTVLPIYDPIYAICNGNYKVVTDADVLKIIKCCDEMTFKFLIKLREFGYITDIDLYDQVYQESLDNLVRNCQDKWFLLGGNMSPSQVKPLIGQNYILNLNTIVKHIEPARLMEWMWGSDDEYKRLVSYLREYGYVTNYDLIKFRLKKTQECINDSTRIS